VKKRIRFSRPSPALAIACIALFVAMGGVSYGVATGSIDSREIKDGSIRNRDFKDGTLRGNEAKRDGWGGGAIKETTLGKIPASSTRWALIDEGGNIVEQSGRFQVVSKPGANGQPVTNPNVYINASSSLVNKGLGATTSLRNVGGGGFDGDVSIARCNTPRVTCVPTNTNNDNTLVVRSLADNADATSGTRGFYIQVSE